MLRRAQRSGLGRRLLTGAARALEARGATSLVIWVLRDNARGSTVLRAPRRGSAKAARAEPLAGGVVAAVAYRWADIATLIG